MKRSVYLSVFYVSEFSGLGIVGMSLGEFESSALVGLNLGASDDPPCKLASSVIANDEPVCRHAPSPEPHRALPLAHIVIDLRSVTRC